MNPSDPLLRVRILTNLNSLSLKAPNSDKELLIVFGISFNKYLDGDVGLENSPSKYLNSVLLSE